MTPEKLAQAFHETYERLAAEFGYKTREASAKPWAEVPNQNKRLMVAVCAEIAQLLGASLEDTARMDWLDGMTRHIVVHIEGKTVIQHNYGAFNFRASIDAVRKNNP